MPSLADLLQYNYPPGREDSTLQFKGIPKYFGAFIFQSPMYVATATLCKYASALWTHELAEAWYTISPTPWWASTQQRLLPKPRVS